MTISQKQSKKKRENFLEISNILSLLESSKGDILFVSKSLLSKILYNLKNYKDIYKKVFTLNLNLNLQVVHKTVSLLKNS